ncbi:unnamed protein product, partial [Didymodactylos carnosus]
MSLVNAKSTNNVKTKLQALVTAKDPTISFIKPAISRSDCWTSFSQIQLSKVSQDYVVCLSCGTVLKWISKKSQLSEEKCLAKQLMNAGAIVGTAVPVKELLPHPST